MEEREEKNYSHLMKSIWNQIEKKAQPSYPKHWNQELEAMAETLVTLLRIEYPEVPWGDAETVFLKNLIYAYGYMVDDLYQLGHSINAYRYLCLFLQLYFTFGVDPRLSNVPNAPNEEIQDRSNEPKWAVLPLEDPITFVPKHISIEVILNYHLQAMEMIQSAYELIRHLYTNCFANADRQTEMITKVNKALIAIYILYLQKAFPEPILPSPPEEGE